MLTRRQMLAASLAAGLVATTRAMGQAPNGQQAPTPVTVALDWTPNTNHIGLFVAKTLGLYAQAGLDVQILPYGDTAAGTLVANGVANFGILGSIGLFTQRTAGADLVATYALVQTETGRLVVNADRTDLQRPKDLDGRTYGGFGSDWENALIGTIIRHDGGKGTFETVTLGTSAYEALANGAVDFTLEVSTWEGVKAELDHVAQRTFRYADFGVPDQHTSFIGSSGAWLDANPETAAAFLKATRDGYGFAIAHPDEATDMLIAPNSDVLTDRALIRASLQALIDGHYLQTTDGVIGNIDGAKMAAMGNFLFAAGILKDVDGNAVTQRPDFSAYYRNAYLESAK
ncbi:MAG TPA: ABC transporter substrate-binding protein [Devosiaceae bacterium]|jgi:ABC-type nitrate/sulfonate/bicarbonate transport system substrate-binding protein